MKIRFVKKLFALGALFLVVLLAAACKNPLNVSAGGGNGALHITWSTGSARTILPASFPDCASFDVVLTPAAGSVVSKTGITDYMFDVQGLESAIYTIEVIGRDSSGNAIVRGSQSGIDMRYCSQNSVSITLSYITDSGSGKLHLTLDFSACTVLPDNVTLTMIDPSGASTTPALTGSGATYGLEYETLASGAYKAVIRATAGSSTALKTESVMIFSGIDTSAALSFAKRDFRSPAVALGNTLSLLSGPGAAIFDGSSGTATFTNECANETMADSIWSYQSPLSSGIVKDGDILYVADRFANAIRKVDLVGGTVTTVAGSPGSAGSTDGTGSAARFDGPQGIVKLGSYLYVADTMNHTIRMIDPATWQVTTIAGSAGVPGAVNGSGVSARFYFPTDIATDGTNLYVADSLYGAVRKIIPASPYTVTTPKSGIGARSLTFVGTTLYTAGGYGIQKASSPYSSFFQYYTYGSGFVDGTATTARFSNIKDITTDGTNLYVTDGNGVRKITVSNMAVSTVAGVPGKGTSDSYIDQDTGEAAVFNYPTGLAYGSNVLYAFDSINQVVKKIDLTSQSVSLVAGKTIADGYANGSAAVSKYDCMAGVASDGTYLYVSELRYNTIRKVSIATGESSFFSGKPSDVIYSGGYADGPATTAEFNQPSGMVVDGDYLYVCDTGNFVIRKVKLSDGSVSTFAGLAQQSGTIDGVGTNCRFVGPQQVASDGDCLYVIDTDYSTVSRICSINLKNGDTQTMVSWDASYVLFGIATDGISVFFSSGYTSRIYAVDIATRTVSDVAGSDPEYCDGVGTSAKFCSPKGLATDGVYLYVCDLNNYAIRKVVIDALNVTTFVGKGEYPGLAYGSGGAARLRGPEYCVMVGSALYVTDKQTQSILKIQ